MTGIEERICTLGTLLDCTPAEVLFPLAATVFISLALVVMFKS